MVWRQTTAISAAALLAGGVIAAQTPRATVIPGRVVSSDGQPLPNARVVVKGTSTWTRAGGEGQFEIDAPQSATLLIAKAGYLNQTIELRPLAGATSVDVRMTRAAAISGRVTDVHGDAMIGMPVEAAPASGSGPKRSTSTDDRGEYRIGELAAGGYVLSVAGASTTYYPDTVVRTEASSVVISAGDERAGIDFHISGTNSYLVVPADLPLVLQQERTVRVASPRPPTGTGTIRGRVLANSGRPLPDAQVMLIAENAGSVRTHGSDENGVYEFAALPPGSYRVLAMKTGFSMPGDTSSNALNDRAPVAATITGGETHDRADVILQPWSAISGRIVDDAGEPVAGARVGLLVTRYERGRRRILGATVASRTTDDRGEYRIWAVPPGQYLISASTLAATSELPGSADTFYPGTVIGGDARVVAVRAGEDAIGMDFALAPPASAAVSGTLVDSTGRPSMGGQFTLMPRGALATSVGARIDEQGRFEFRNIPPGQYVIRADRGRRAGSIEGEFGAFPITVDRADLKGLALKTSEGSRISGRFVFESAAGPVLSEPRGVEVAPIPDDFDLAPGSFAAAGPKPDGTFELLGISGNRRLQLTRTPPQWTLKAITSNARDITDELLHFGARGESLNDVEVILTDRVSEVSGRVTDDRARPLSGARVVLFSTTPEQWYFRSRFVQSAASSADGAYWIGGLPAGSYFAAAVSRVPDGETPWYDPVWLDAIRPQAIVVTVGDGRRQAVNLRIGNQ